MREFHTECMRVERSGLSLLNMLKITVIYQTNTIKNSSKSDNVNDNNNDIIIIMIIINNNNNQLYLHNNNSSNNSIRNNY